MAISYTTNARLQKPAVADRNWDVPINANADLLDGMTAIGGLLHTLPFLVSNLQVALYLAYIVVGCELVAISYIRYHFFKMNFWLSALQVIVGGGLVFAAGVLIGSA